MAGFDPSIEVLLPLAGAVSPRTVRRYVAALRRRVTSKEAFVHRSMAPGTTMEVDFGESWVDIAGAPCKVKYLVATLPFSNAYFAKAYPVERLESLLDGIESAFAYFGGVVERVVLDNTSLAVKDILAGRDRVQTEAFAAFRGAYPFRAEFCAPAKGWEKGKVESGVKYLKRNFLAGRRFCDDLDFNEQLQEWMATVADVRVHGTTHERLIDRFARERDALVPAPPGRAFRLEAPLTRVVATDYLVTVDTNRYSVPFTLIGQPVEVMRRNGFLQMRHRGRLVATHPVLGGRH